MEREKFEELVGKAVADLPGEFFSRLENIDIVVEDQPTRRQLRETGMKPGETLLGLYHGVPLTDRSQNYGLVAPDKITIFQKPIEAICRSEAAIKTEIKRVVQHEIAHHFGIGDARLKQLEKD